MVTEQRQREHFAGVGPGDGGGRPHAHVTREETTENESVTQEENPHHGFAPVHLERLLVARPVFDYARQPFCKQRISDYIFRHNDKSRSSRQLIIDS